ncbi:Serine/threonine-protein kinase RUNKEL [Arachis hypogaea]|nr:Serine/threonine-protein kinase RUNKEL [Arachis hypogaea]
MWKLNISQFQQIQGCSITFPEVSDNIQLLLTKFSPLCGCILFSLLNCSNPIIIIVEINFHMMGGRCHGHISALTSRSAPKTNIHLFPVVLYLRSSSIFKHKVVTIHVLRQLASLIKLIETLFQILAKG